jgi:hypothetical protein
VRRDRKREEGDEAGSFCKDSRRSVTPLLRWGEGEGEESTNRLDQYYLSRPIPLTDEFVLCARPEPPVRLFRHSQRELLDLRLSEEEKVREEGRVSEEEVGGVSGE